MANMSKLEEARNSYDYLLVLDFEATCMRKARICPQEIIEFPCLLLDSNMLEEVFTFHKYIKPIHHPMVTDFCTEFTGITQETVDISETFPAVFAQFQDWLHQVVTSKDRTAVFVTCGNWDLDMMLPAQMELCHMSCNDIVDMEVLHLFDQHWINLKGNYTQLTGNPIVKSRNDLTQMQEAFNLPLIGHLHSGIADVRNMATLIRHMAKVKAGEADNVKREVPGGGDGVVGIKGGVRDSVDRGGVNRGDVVVGNVGEVNNDNNGSTQSA